MANSALEASGDFSECASCLKVIEALSDAEKAASSWEKHCIGIGVQTLLTISVACRAGGTTPVACRAGGNGVGNSSRRPGCAQDNVGSSKGKEVLIGRLCSLSHGGAFGFINKVKACFLSHSTF